MGFVGKKDMEYMHNVFSPIQKTRERESIYRQTDRTTDRQAGRKTDRQEDR